LPSKKLVIRHKFGPEKAGRIRLFFGVLSSRWEIALSGSVGRRRKGASWALRPRSNTTTKVLLPQLFSRDRVASLRSREGGSVGRTS
jgi:hypothetical protein